MHRTGIVSLMAVSLEKTKRLNHIVALLFLISAASAHGAVVIGSLGGDFNAGTNLQTFDHATGQSANYPDRDGSSSPPVNFQTQSTVGGNSASADLQASGSTDGTSTVTLSSDASAGASVPFYDPGSGIDWIASSASSDEDQVDITITGQAASVHIYGSVSLSAQATDPNAPNYSSTLTLSNDDTSTTLLTETAIDGTSVPFDQTFTLPVGNYSILAGSSIGAYAKESTFQGTLGSYIAGGQSSATYNITVDVPEPSLLFPVAAAVASMTLRQRRRNRKTAV